MHCLPDEMDVSANSCNDQTALLLAMKNAIIYNPRAIHRPQKIKGKPSETQTKSKQANLHQKTIAQ
jgi:hypothetical protein